jgi:hypothetical protein
LTNKVIRGKAITSKQVQRPHGSEVPLDKSSGLPTNLYNASAVPNLGKALVSHRRGFVDSRLGAVLQTATRVKMGMSQD